MFKARADGLSKTEASLIYDLRAVDLGVEYSLDLEVGGESNAYINSDLAGDQEKGFTTTGAVIY